MTTKLVAIGNSKGLRLSKAILEAARLKDEVRVQVEAGKLIVTPAGRRRNPRKGWSEAIREEIERGGPLEAIDPAWESLANAWDEEGWKW
ncbi:MAG TPA: hypothetical protein VIL86_03715 [Tepidisphaeraceae bacterium]|jgi:antitoxin MazE